MGRALWVVNYTAGNSACYLLDTTNLCRSALTLTGKTKVNSQRSVLTFKDPSSIPAFSELFTHLTQARIHEKPHSLKQAQTPPFHRIKFLRSEASPATPCSVIRFHTINNTLYQKLLGLT